MTETPDSPGQWARMEPIERSSLPDEIVQRLTTFILESGLTTGDRMPSERQLMTMLAVGRSSLREAIKTLTTLGIVRVIGGDGMFVGEGKGLITKPVAWGLLVGHHETHEVIEARRIVESQMAGLAAERATEAQVAAIQAQLSAMHEAVGHPDRFTEADLAFHLLVARTASNAVLSHVLETLQYIVRVWIYRTFTEFPDNALDSYAEHVPIAEAIAAQDRAGATTAMSAHLESAASRLLQILERTGGS